MSDFPQLLYPIDSFQTRRVGDVEHVYDQIRSKYVVLTPEEWVRQNIVRYLVEELGYPQGRVRVEADMQVFRKARRADIVVYNSHLDPVMVVECKRPEIELSQQVANQVAEYNIPLQAPWLVVTNGRGFYCWQVDVSTGASILAAGIPEYAQITS